MHLAFTTHTPLTKAKAPPISSFNNRINCDDVQRSALAASFGLKPEGSQRVQRLCQQHRKIVVVCAEFQDTATTPAIATKGWAPWFTAPWPGEPPGPVDPEPEDATEWFWAWLRCWLASLGTPVGK